LAWSPLIISRRLACSHCIAIVTRHKFRGTELRNVAQCMHKRTRVLTDTDTCTKTDTGTCTKTDTDTETKKHLLGNS
jgi:hypothetical protein